MKELLANPATQSLLQSALGLIFNLLVAVVILFLKKLIGEIRKLTRYQVAQGVRLESVEKKIDAMAGISVDVAYLKERLAILEFHVFRPRGRKRESTAEKRL
jgi:hypothetical protein